jgi:hypothetical protein
MDSAQIKITPDQLLTKMLAFAESPECPTEKKFRLINGAYKTWADAITNHNKFDYEKVKGEQIYYIENIPILNKPKTYSGIKRKKMTAADWIQRRKDAQYKTLLKKELAKSRGIAPKKESKPRTNESKKKPVIDLNTKEIYSSCTECAIKNNIQIGTLNNYLLGKNKSGTKLSNFVYLYEYEKKDFKPKEIIVKEKKPFHSRLNAPRFNSKKIIDLNTNVIYDSLTHFCNEMDMSISSVCRFLKTNDRNYLVKRIRETLNIKYCK